MLSNHFFYLAEDTQKLDIELTHQLSLIFQLRQAFLREAMQGTLVSNETRDGATGHELLEEIRKEKERLVKEKTIKKQKPLPPITEEEIPFEIPENWVWCRLGDLSSKICYGTSEKTKDSGDVPVLRMGNISLDGKLEFNNLKYVDKSIKDLPDLYLEPYDLLFNRTNSYELVGKSAVFNNLELYTCASYLIIVKFLIKPLSLFIVKYLNSSICRITQLEPYIIQQNGQANFNGTKLSQIIVPLPPLEIQERIVAKLDELMQYCDALELQVKESRSLNEQHLQQVLREAPEGKPIEQLTNELPAMVAEEEPEYQTAKIYDNNDTAILAGHTINSLSTSNSADLGRVKLLKMMHLLQYHCQLETPLHFTKKTAGPYTSALENQIERKLQQHRYFDIKKEKLKDFVKVTYEPLAKSVELERLFHNEFADKAVLIDSMLSKFRSKDTGFCERVSTMYAVWNNRLLKNEPVSDELLKADFLAWDERKSRFKNELDSTLDWMRSNGVVPVGYGEVI